MPAERAMIKLPLQFRELFGKPESAQLTEQVGEDLAKWAAGGVKGNADVEVLIADYAKSANRHDLDVLEARRKAIWTKALSPTFKAQLKEAADSATVRLAPVDRISLDQATVLADALKEEGVELSLLLAQFEIGALEELKAAKYEEAKTFISETSAQ